MDFLTMYFLIMLPSIGGFFIGVGIVTIIVSGVLLIVKVIDDWGEEDERRTRELIRLYAIKVAVISMSFIFVGALIPSEKQMVYLVGGYAVTNTKNIEKLPKNVVNAANKFLEDYAEQDKK